jgi:acetyl esterase/lipase
MRIALFFTAGIVSVFMLSRTARGDEGGEGRSRLIARQSQSLPVRRGIVFAKRPERELKLDIYYPKGRQVTLRPAIMYISGAAWKTEDREIKLPSSDLPPAPTPDVYPPIMATRGYVVVSPDYRPSTEAIFPAAVLDLVCAVNWIGTHGPEFGIDRARIGIMSGSAPAHLAALVATAGAKREFKDASCGSSARTPVRAVYCFAGFFDFQYYRQAPGDGTLAKQIAQFLGGSYEQVPTNYEKGSVTKYVDATTPPFFLVHGLQDRRVPYEQSVHFARTLQKAGVPVRLVSVNDYEHGPIAGHQPDPPYELIDEQVYAFFDRYLKKRPAK